MHSSGWPRIEKWLRYQLYLVMMINIRRICCSESIYRRRGIKMCSFGPPIWVVLHTFVDVCMLVVKKLWNSSIECCCFEVYWWILCGIVVYCGYYYVLYVVVKCIVCALCCVYKTFFCTVVFVKQWAQLLVGKNVYLKKLVRIQNFEGSYDQYLWYKLAWLCLGDICGR
jgi:hypothetical protein